MTEDDLNLALYHALMIRFKLGLFDPVDDQPYWHVDPDGTIERTYRFSYGYYTSRICFIEK